MTQPAPLSDSTKRLLERLQLIIEDTGNPTLTPSELFALHVRSQLTPQNAPQFGEDQLKLAYVELIRAAQ